jgi:para-nitrobenzyl esterase
MAGKETDVPVLVGSNADEARALITDLDAVKASTFSEDIAKSWGALPPALLAAYPFVTDEEARKARLAFERDLRFGWDAWACARLVSSRRSCDVYYYHFTHRPPFPADSVRANWGPSHYAELWYMFDHLNQETWAWSPKDRKLADTMSSYWTNFIKSGNPNGRGLPLWPKFTPNKEQVQYLDDMIETKGVANLKSLRAVDAVYSQVRGAPLGH